MLKKNESHNDQKRVLGKYLRYSQAGLQFAVAVGLFTWGGIWLDRKLSTGVLFTLLGLALGFGGGARALYLEVYGRERESKRTTGRPGSDTDQVDPRDQGPKPSESKER